MPETLTKSEFAQRRGVEPSAVSNWIARGQLSGAALTEDGRIAVAEAERQLAQLVDPGRGAPHALAPFAPPASDEPAVYVPPPAGSLADIRLRIETLRLAEIEREASVRRRELIVAADAQAAWAQALEDLMGSLEQFMLDLPGKVGLDREGAVRVREEFRAWRTRLADQAMQSEDRVAA